MCCVASVGKVPQTAGTENSGEGPGRGITVNQPERKRPIDAQIACLLSQLPHYQTWDQITLPVALQASLDAADQQRLMCIIAYSMRRLMDDGQLPSRSNSA